MAGWSDVGLGNPTSGIVSRLTADDARAVFRTHFSSPDVSEVRIARAPGRVNLIGEHTDYNGGLVLPLALDRATWVAFAPSSQERVRIWSEATQSEDDFATDTRPQHVAERWRNYPRGVAAMLQASGIELAGMDAAVASDVPFGAGVSSSASFEVGIALAMLAVSGQSLEARELALLCQRAENDFVGMHCGVLDQFASIFGRRDSAILLDCQTLVVTPVQMPQAFTVVVCDTAKPREGVEEAYNTRRSQCEAAASALGVDNLSQISIERLAEAGGILDEATYRRCRHVVTENERVRKTVQALQYGDIQGLGHLISASHSSLRDDYEVSCHELDVMCEIAETVPGCVGARLVGAGFGGCAIAIVKAGTSAAFIAETAPRYEAATGRKPRIFAAHAADGAGYES